MGTPAPVAPRCVATMASCCARKSRWHSPHVWSRSPPCRETSCTWWTSSAAAPCCCPSCGPSATCARLPGRTAKVRHWPLRVASRGGYGVWLTRPRVVLRGGWLPCSAQHAGPLDAVPPVLRDCGRVRVLVHVAHIAAASPHPELCATALCFYRVAEQIHLLHAHHCVPHGHHSDVQAGACLAAHAVKRQLEHLASHVCLRRVVVRCRRGWVPFR